MSDPYAHVPPPPSVGDYPDRVVFSTPGQSVEGFLRAVRMSPADKYDPCPILDLQTNTIGADGQPVCWSVFCNPTSLWRQLDQQKPPIGSYLRVTFIGHEGQAKIFTLEVAPAGSVPPPAGGIVPVVTAPAPQPQAPAGFPPADAFGAGNQPAPWGQPAPAAPAPAPAAPWGN